jgi:hypothetical protein
MVSVGWGDFDAAEKRQAAGLQITKRMIPKKQWKKKPPNSWKFAKEDGTHRRTVYNQTPEEERHGGGPNRSLRELVPE